MPAYCHSDVIAHCTYTEANGLYKKAVEGFKQDTMALGSRQIPFACASGGPVKNQWLSPERKQ